LFVVIGLCLALNAAAPAAQVAQVGQTVRVTVAQANVRADANANAPVLTTVKSGARLEVRGVEGDWYKVAMFVGAVRFEAYVSKRVVALEKTAAGGAGAASAAATAEPPVVAKFGMSATFESNYASEPLAPTVAKVVPLAARADSARAAATAMPLGAGAPLPASPTAVITYVWAVDGASTDRVITERRPTLVVKYDAAPGISPDDFTPAIVRLVGTPAGTRVMSAMRARVDQSKRSVLDWDVARELKQEVVKATVELADRGIASVRPDTDLEPGSYAVVMRPAGNKKFSGASVLSPNKDGRAFGICWVFSVKVTSSVSEKRS
jgi:hypothetical protein